MRLKKQSMREIADAGMAAHHTRNMEAVGDVVHHQATQKPGEQRVYIRGALVKPKRTDNRR